MVVAIESGWFAGVMQESVYLYELPADTFMVLNSGVGYFISQEPVVPLSIRHVTDIVAELLQHDVELRAMQ